MTYAIWDVDSGNIIGNVPSWQEGVNVIEDLRDPDLMLMEFDEEGLATKRTYMVMV